MEAELKKLGVMQERLDVYKGFFEFSSSGISTEWAMKNILGLDKERIEYIKNPLKIKKVKDWKKNN